MKRKPVSILAIALATTAAGMFCLIANAGAQENTSVSDNPHLRKKDEPARGTTKKLSEKDVHFLQAAASSGLAEVADGRVAQSMGQSADVKSIGSRMVADHSRANRELADLAKTKGLAMDMGKGKPRDFNKERFDRQYLVSMEKDHETDIQAFEKEAASGDDADVKGWAKKTIPTLKAHLAMVKEAIQKKK
jgi:putative membrane protein